MKKLMFVAAAVLAGAVFAEGEITSNNIVGYTSKDAEQAKFYLLAAQFDKVGGGRGINDLISGLEGVDYGEGFEETAPQIQIRNGNNYDYYFYLNDAWYDDNTEEGATKPGWADANGNLVETEFDEGSGFWLKSPLAAAKPNVAGEVSDAASVDVACGTGFQLVANVFPIAITFNGPQMTSEDILGVDYSETFTDEATQIQVRNGTSYKYYFYLNDAWYNDGTEEGATKPGWADANGNLVEDVIPAMAGFWTKGTSGAFTLTFKGL